MDPQNQQSINPIQPIIQNSTTATRNWYKILLFILFGLIISAGLIFAGMQIAKKQTPNQQQLTENPIISPNQTIISPTVLPTTNIMANWQKYSNPTWEYSLQYPQGTFTRCDYDNDAYVGFFQPSFDCGPTDQPPPISINTYEKGKYQDSKPASSTENITVNGISAVKKIYIETEEVRPYPDVKETICVILENEKGTIKFTLFTSNSDIRNLFYQMLSTLQL